MSDEGRFWLGVLLLEISAGSGMRLLGFAELSEGFMFVVVTFIVYGSVLFISNSEERSQFERPTGSYETFSNHFASLFVYMSAASLWAIFPIYIAWHTTDFFLELFK